MDIGSDANADPQYGILFVFKFVNKIIFKGDRPARLDWPESSTIG
jgi:hypothetical protein